jgi:hypothetical protein
MRVKLFQPFAETKLRIRVTVELLDPGAAFDCFAVDVSAPAAGPGPDGELERRAVERARQLLAVAAHSLNVENTDGRASHASRGDESHRAAVSAVTPAV